MTEIVVESIDRWSQAAGERDQRGIQNRRPGLVFVLSCCLSMLLYACGSGAEPAHNDAASSAVIEPAAQKRDAATDPAAIERPQQKPPTEPPAAATPKGEEFTFSNYRYDVLYEYPHDNRAYTQGLQFIDGQLYESTGQWGRSSLRRVQLESGEVLQQHDLAGRYFGEGMTVVGNKIYQLTWRSGVAFVYDKTSFAVIDTMRYTGEGWGLTYDGTDLIMSDGSAKLQFRDPEDFSLRRSVEVLDGSMQLGNLNELEYINGGAWDGELWANVYTSDMIARIDPASGRVLGMINLRGLLKPSDDPERTAEVLNGIAWDADEKRLFVTGKNWPKLFEINLIAD